MSTVIDIKRDLIASIESFILWINKNGFESYDQYDFWSTFYGKFAKKIYYSNHLLGIPLISPIIFLDLFLPESRMLFVNKKRFPIADAHLIMAYVNLFKIFNDTKFLNMAISISDDLLKTNIQGYSGHCWGYPFDWQTNRGLWNKNTPLITTTPYCFEAFLCLYDITNSKKYFEIAYSIANFAAKDIKDTKISDISHACSYSPIDKSMVINANTYRAFLLMEAWKRFGKSDFKEKAVKNINFVLENQNFDGSWLYAVGNPQDAFIDNFHTCFVLKNLYKSNVHLKDAIISKAILKGYNYYRENLFTKQNIPKPFAVLSRLQTVQVELYDYSEGICLGVLLKDNIKDAFAFAINLAQQVYSNYQLSDGHFVTRINLAGFKNKVPYLRWPQAQMFYTLTTLYKTLEEVSCVE